MKKHAVYIFIGLFIVLLLTVLCFIPVGVSKMIPGLENKISDEFGIKVHMEKLILRGGPFLKLKSPVVYLMYDDGQKFGQFDNIKFYISWSSLLKHEPNVCKIYANRVILNVNSDDKKLNELLKRLNKKEFKQTPDVFFKEYRLSYFDKKQNDNYLLEGSNLDLRKIYNYENWKIKTDGNFYINDKKHLNISIDIKNKYNYQENNIRPDFKALVSQLKTLEYYSDIISDLTIYKNKDNVFQASGFINIDNISILDKDKKCPKSFIYATLWGNKASILSNIYTAENKKVYIDGMISKAKRTTLDLKVKTDKIELADLYKKLKVFSFCSGLENLTSLSGQLEANFTLKGDLSKIKSGGYLKISDAKIDANGILIEQINSDIDLSNNRINIKEAIGKVKQAPVSAKGSIDKNINIELQMAQVPIKHLVPQNAGIKNGIITLYANISGDIDNILHKEKLQIDNLNIEKDGYSVSLTSLNIDTNKDNTAYIKNLLCTTPYSETVKIPSLKSFVEKNDIIIPVTRVYMPNSNFELQGKIANYFNKDFNFDTKIDGKLYSKDVKFLNSIQGIFPVKLSINGNKIVQNTVFQMLFENAAVFTSPSVISVSLKKENNDIKIEEAVVADYNGKFTDDYKSNVKNNKKIVLNGTIENIENPRFKNIRVLIPQTVNINLCDTVAQVKGDLFINGIRNNPDITGQFSITNLYNQMMQMTIINSIFDFNKNIVTFNIPNVKVSDSVMSITGIASTDNIFKELNIKQLNLKSKYMNTDTFLMYNDRIFKKSYPVIVNNSKFYIEKLNTILYGSPLCVSAVSGDFNIHDNIFEVKNLSAEAFNGKIAGQISYNANEDLYKSNIMARQISATPLFSMVMDNDDTISGTMDIDTQLSGSLALKNNINGELKFIVHNGRMSTLGRLEHLLYAQNVIADNMLRASLNTIIKAVSLKDTGLFKYLRGSVLIKNGVANINYIQSQGPLMSLLIKGSYNLNDETARLSILGRLSDEITNGLGAFGEFSFDKLKIMLTGEENRYKIKVKDLEMLPQLTSKNTREFYSIINGNVKKSNSVILFNWISYTEKSLRQKEVPMTNVQVPAFIDEIVY